MNESAPIRILCVDDHPLVHEGIATVIRNQPDMTLIAEAFNGRDAVQKFREHKPDVVLLDLRLPDMSGIDTMITIRNEFPEARAIILTTFEGDAEIQRALVAGARAYVLKSMPPKELVEVIRKVHAGKKPIPPQIAAQLAEHYGDESLTEREIDVLRQIAGGNRNRDIAEKLFISEETVKVHIKHIMEKLYASDRTEGGRDCRPPRNHPALKNRICLTPGQCHESGTKKFRIPGIHFALQSVTLHIGALEAHERISRRRGLQRFFSTFPGGWPCVGLFLLRAAVGLTAVIQGGFFLTDGGSQTVTNWVIGLIAVASGA